MCFKNPLPQHELFKQVPHTVSKKKKSKPEHATWGKEVIGETKM